MVLAMLQKIEKYLSINREVLLLYIEIILKNFHQTLLLLACPIDSGCPGF
jgi:hypothetical protein